MTALTDPWIPRGRVATLGSVASTTTGVVGTDVMTTVTDGQLTATTGRLYLVVTNVTVTASVTGGTDEVIELNLRDGGASAPTTASTLVTTWRMPMQANSRAIRRPFMFVIDGLTSGLHRLGVSANRLNGTGTYTIGSATAGLQQTFDVFDYGLA